MTESKIYRIAFYNQGDIYELHAREVHQSNLYAFVEVTNGARTVPQIVIDGECIGGFSELTELHMEDKLDHLVQA